MAVERFLQLAGRHDYAGMGLLFGTVEGPILARDGASQVEQRMFGLASLIEYDRFIVGSGSPVPGRAGVALRFDVILVRGDRTLQIPITAVKGPGRRWFVEQMTVELLSG